MKLLSLIIFQHWWADTSNSGVLSSNPGIVRGILVFRYQAKVNKHWDKMFLFFVFLLQLFKSTQIFLLLSTSTASCTKLTDGISLSFCSPLSILSLYTFSLLSSLSVTSIYTYSLSVLFLYLILFEPIIKKLLLSKSVEQDPNYNLEPYPGWSHLGQPGVRVHAEHRQSQPGEESLFLHQDRQRSEWQQVKAPT